jgi:hypothetical protein
LAGVLIVHVHVHVPVPVHDAFLTNATVAATVWLVGVLIVHVPVLVPVHDAFLRNATVVKLHAGLVCEYRFAVNVYASSANHEFCYHSAVRCCDRLGFLLVVPCCFTLSRTLSG